MKRLENWSINTTGSLYQAPETAVTHLNGEVYGHDRFPEGHGITTSAVVSSEGNLVMTYSGSTYLLGDPSEDYVKWCRENEYYIPTQQKPFRNVD